MLLIDAGPLYAAAARNDRNHSACRELLATALPPLIVPELVVTEVAYLIADRLGARAETAFAQSLADGELMVEAVEAREWRRIHELVERYEDLPLGIVDACVVVLAERLHQDTVASLDHRHLGVVQPSHTDRLRLVPQPHG